MALKDLVADRNAITEEMIEKIVAEYVRYDPNSCEIIFTPAGLRLNNETKVLVALVAILGWQYVVDEVPSIDTKPAALEAITGVQGNTLRPILKKLKEAYLITQADGHYSARVANLNAIASIVAGNSEIGSAARSSVRRGSSPPPKSEAGQEKRQPGSKTRSKSTVPIRASLNRLIEERYFSEFRTLPEVVERLHELAIIAKTTSLSGPIAELVRDGKLTRCKVNHGAKKIWGYKAATG